MAFRTKVVLCGCVIDAHTADVQPQGVETDAGRQEGGVWYRDPDMGPSAVWDSSGKGEQGREEDGASRTEGK